MENINEYDRKTFEPAFKKTETYAKLVELYGDNICFEKTYSRCNGYVSTPRGELTGKPIVTAVPFYYLQYINTDAVIHDLCCGTNFFKSFYNVKGYDYDLRNVGYEFYADVDQEITYEWLEEHRGCLDAAISVCGLHFRPVEELRKIVLAFADALKPGATGFISLNTKRFNDKLDKPYNRMQMDLIVREQLSDFPHEFVVFDFFIDVEEDKIDGNLRMVIKNTSNDL